MVRQRLYLFLVGIILIYGTGALALTGSGPVRPGQEDGMVPPSDNSTSEQIADPLPSRQIGNGSDIPSNPLPSRQIGNGSNIPDGTLPSNSVAPDASSLGKTSPENTIPRSCEDVVQEAEDACTGKSKLGMITSFAQLAMGILSSNATDALAACKAQQRQAQAALASTTTMSGQCVSAATRCQQTCNSWAKFDKTNFYMYDKQSKKCDKLLNASLASKAEQFAQINANFRQSKQCENLIAAADCSVPDAVNRPTCLVQYCPTHQNDPICAGYQCTLDMAKDNANCPQYDCVAHADDTAHCFKPMAIAASSPVQFDSTSTTTPYSPYGEGGSGDFGSMLDENPGNGDLSHLKQSTAGSSGPGPGNDSASGGAGLGGGAPYPGGNGGQQGASGGAAGYKDPGGGVGSGGGGGGYNFPGNTVGGNSNGGGRGGSGGDGIDLSKFLPGGELDPTKRQLASAREGISGANDLSNFEKVTRMMNKKRELLKPAEGM